MVNADSEKLSFHQNCQEPPMGLVQCTFIDSESDENLILEDVFHASNTGTLEDDQKTCNFADGVDIPIPTYPELLIIILGVEDPEVLNTKFHSD